MVVLTCVSPSPKSQRASEPARLQACWTGWPQQILPDIILGAADDTLPSFFQQASSCRAVCYSRVTTTTCAPPEAGICLHGGQEPWHVVLLTHDVPESFDKEGARTLMKDRESSAKPSAGHSINGLLSGGHHPELLTVPPPEVYTL